MESPNPRNTLRELAIRAYADHAAEIEDAERRQRLEQRNRSVEHISQQLGDWGVEDLVRLQYLSIGTVQAVAVDDPAITFHWDDDENYLVVTVPCPTCQRATSSEAPTLQVVGELLTTACSLCTDGPY